MSNREALDLAISALHDAISAGDMRVLDDVITRQSVSRDLKDVLTDALVLSCAGTYQEAATYLLKQKNTDPNSVSLVVKAPHTHMPPLVVVARSCHKIYSDNLRPETRVVPAAEMIVQLLEHGARLSNTAPNGTNALFYISHLRIADALLGSKDAADLHAALNARTSDGQDALYAMLSRDGDSSIALAKSLIEKGANVQRSYGGLLTPLHYAAVYGDSDLIETLLKHGADIHITCENLGDGNLTGLHIACAAGAEAVVKLLLAMNADREARTNDRMTPLHIAASQGYCSIVQLLLADAKASYVNSVCVGDWTPLHLACSAGKPSSKLFESLGPRTDHLERLGRTKCATKQDYVEVIRHLLSRGAEPNKKSSSSETALHLAARSGHDHVVKALLECKDIHIAAKDHLGVTPLVNAANIHHAHLQTNRQPIIDSLAPWSHYNIKALPQHVTKVTQDFNANIVDFDGLKGEPMRRQIPVFNLLYEDFKMPGYEHTCERSTKPTGRYKFRWTHLPANNVSWCRSLFAKWFIEHGSSDSLILETLERSLSQHQYQESRAHSIYMRSTFNESSASPNGQSLAYLYMPFLELGTTPPTRTSAHAQGKAFTASILSEPVEFAHTTSTPQKVAGGADRDSQLLQAYGEWKFNEDRIHVRRTLDQFWYKNVNTDCRDETQVISRHFSRKQTDDEGEVQIQPNSRGILVVDQLWMWIFEDLVVTCLPHKGKHHHETQSSTFNSILERVDDSSNVSELASAITKYCTSACDRNTRRECGLGYCELFSSEVGMLMNEQVRLFDKFKWASGEASTWIRNT